MPFPGESDHQPRIHSKEQGEKLPTLERRHAVLQALRPLLFLEFLQASKPALGENGFA